MSFRQVLAVAMLFAAGAAYAQTTDPQAETTRQEVEQTAPVAEDGIQAADALDEPQTPAADADTGVAMDAPVVAPADSSAMHPADPTLRGDADAGAGKSVVCAACHGQDGNAIIEMYPKLAGQNEAYMVRQLQLYQSGERMDPVMSAFAAPLSAQDMHDLGAYFALQSPNPGVADEALVERGRMLYHGGDASLGVPACMACHGPDGGGMAGSGYPHLSGQWADYSVKVLRAWKEGNTWGDSPNARIMPEIVARLSEGDLDALASYMEGLHTAQPGAR